MNTTPARYRCEYCHNDDASVRETADGFMCCTFCDDVCARRFICEVCEERDVTDGCEVCWECLIDAVVADPRELDTCSQPLRDKIGRELATRFGALTRRQAA